MPAATQQQTRNPANEVFVSVVSLWEIIIKHALGRLPLPHPPEVFIPAQA
jgi:PIN domain nuclease of toxin-antitoxin system